MCSNDISINILFKNDVVWSCRVKANLFMFSYRLFIFVLPLTIQSSRGGGFVYICIAVDDPVIKRGRVCSYLYCRWRSSHQEGAADPINWFNCTTFLCLSKPRVWISNIICCFVDHHCLKLSFHNLQDIKISSIPSHNIKPLVYLFIVQDENYESTWIKQWKVR